MVIFSRGELLLVLDAQIQISRFIPGRFVSGLRSTLQFVGMLIAVLIRWLRMELGRIYLKGGTWKYDKSEYLVSDGSLDEICP